MLYDDAGNKGSKKEEKKNKGGGEKVRQMSLPKGRRRKGPSGGAKVHATEAYRE